MIPVSSNIRCYLEAHVQGPHTDHPAPEHISKWGRLGHWHRLLLLGRLHVHPVHDVVRDGNLVIGNKCLLKPLKFSLLHLVGSSRLLDDLLSLSPLSICQEPSHRLRHNEEQTRKSWNEWGWERTCYKWINCSIFSSYPEVASGPESEEPSSRGQSRPPGPALLDRWRRESRWRLRSEKWTWRPRAPPPARSWPWSTRCLPSPSGSWSHRTRTRPIDRHRTLWARKGVLGSDRSLEILMYVRLPFRFGCSLRSLLALSLKALLSFSEFFEESLLLTKVYLAVRQNVSWLGPGQMEPKIVRLVFSFFLFSDL